MNKVPNVYQDQIVDIVERIEFFENFTHAELSRLIDLKTHLYAYFSGEHIIREGEIDGALFILLTGEVRVQKNGQEISIFSSGDCFGEVSFISGEPRSADVVALEKILVIRMQRHLFLRLPIELREKLQGNLISTLVHRLEQVNHKVASLSDTLDEHGIKEE